MDNLLAITASIGFGKVQISNNTAATLVHLQTDYVNITDSRFNYNKGYSALVYAHTTSIDIYQVQISNNVGGPSLLMQNTVSIMVHSLKLIGNTVLLGNGLVAVSMGAVSFTIVFNEMQVSHNTIKNGTGLLSFTSSRSISISMAEPECSKQKIDVVNAKVENNNGNMRGTVIYITNPCLTINSTINRRYCIKIDYTIAVSTFSHITNFESVIYVIGPPCFFQLYLQNSLLIRNCTFSNNYSPALHMVNSSLVLAEKVTFDNNLAEYGGAVILNSNSTLTITPHSEITFNNNHATRYGGAIYCNVLLENDCFKNVSNAILILNESNTVIEFNGNTAELDGDSVYLQVPTSCYELFQNESNITTHYLGKYMVTSPAQLWLYPPAHLLANFTNPVNHTFIIHNIMLGQNIIFPSCALDYNYKPAKTVPFLLRTVDRPPGYTLISTALYSAKCGSYEENNLQVIGQRVSTNYTPIVTIQLSLYDNQYNWKPFYTSLILELSPCHSGFYYNSLQENCTCYTTDNIVSCSGISATIRRGYWFGEVNDHPTVTVCPVNFCNFDNCDITTGTCPLMALPDDQCEGSRSGAACGSCTDGYTLPFDYHECVSINTCTTGYTVMVVTIACLYWILIIIAVFGLMYFKVGIGYLYSVTFYYSVLDILFGQILQNSKALHDFVTISSSLARLTPKFLGQICLVKGLSGIDQQFIHYTHPLAVVLLLVLLSVLTRFSPRLSLFISRGVIHVICFLLLLSYTSISSTSLLLMRPLMFTGVDKVYTYLSPDLEYFHGRHLVYVLVAIPCALVIAIGLPLLLTLEPFLNYKINFTRFKPLLDQFQGCYKDKYRYFASCYMICRLIILVIINININNNTSITLYLLLSTFAVICLINATIQPYSCYAVNVIDNSILLIMMLDILLQMIDVSNGFAANATIIVAYVLTVLPVLIVATVGIILNEQYVMKYVTCYSKYCKSNKGTEITNQDAEISSQTSAGNNSRQKYR